MVHQTVTNNAKHDSAVKTKPNAILERIKTMALESVKAKPDGNGPHGLFGKLSQTVHQYDERCPINREIKAVKRKIMRKRARIHLVQQEGIKPLWSKDGSYEPAQIY